MDIETERIEHTLPRINQIISLQKPKSGLSFKILLQELDHEIDWRLATELEKEYFNSHATHANSKLYDNCPVLHKSSNFHKFSNN